MAVLEDLTEDEAYLWAVLSDASGLDQAEFTWYDPENDDGCFRAWPFQWKWWRSEDPKQIDQCSRAVGKSKSIQVRACAFPLIHPRQEMVITAPEGVHLDAVTDNIETQITSTRLLKSLLQRERGKSAIKHKPFHVNFANGSRIMGRIPQRDGKGMKGTHPIWLELDEGQDYPEPGWKETIETLKRGSEGAVWRAHGVTRGVRDVFYRLTQPNSGWSVHRYTAMHRPNWTDQEREEKIMDYGGSRDHPDYKRNILGLHGDATNPLFVLHRLMACVDQVKSSEYNTDVYYERKISDEELSDGGGHIANLINLPGSHKGLSKTFWVGMDVGFTNHPSEVLVFGEISEKKLKAANIIGVPDDGPSALPKGDQALILLTRLKLDRISHPHQVDLIDYICNYYDVQAFSMDKTGNGLPLFQDAQHRSKKLANLIKGYNFSEKILVDFDLTVDVDEFKGDLVEDSGIKKNVLEYSSDVLRDMVDNKRIVLPFDRELIAEFEGQTYFVVRDTMNQYGKREFSKGQLHALDAAKMAVLGMKQNSIEEFTKQEKFEPVMDIFFG